MMLCDEETYYYDAAASADDGPTRRVDGSDVEITISDGCLSCVCSVGLVLLVRGSVLA